MGTRTRTQADHLDAVRQVEDLGEARRKLGELLQLEGPATTAVTSRVLADSKFAEKLLSVRLFPEWRDRLLNDPMNAAFDVSESNDTGAKTDSYSVKATVELVGKSAKALLKWGASGFKAADPWVMEKRKAACVSCPHLIVAPGAIVYKIAGAFTRGDSRVCSACGCLMAKKIMVPDETCPVASDHDPHRSRWDDLI